jgi:hypothetical protein
MDEDYDIYGGAPWSAYHDEIDPYEYEESRRAAELESPNPDEAEQILAEMRYSDEQFFNNQDRWDAFHQQQDELLNGLGDGSGA